MNLAKASGKLPKTDKIDAPHIPLLFAKKNN
jgi:hypothetical protein